jgi:methylmalonyl-CoA mutase N-terminal domain/subunit
MTGRLEAAAAIERGFRKGDRIVVGVNKCDAGDEEPYQPPRADATLGEGRDALRVVWGEYRPGEM